MKSKEPPLEVETAIGDDLIRLNHYGKDGGFIGLFTKAQLEKRKNEKKKVDKAKNGKKKNKY